MLSRLAVSILLAVGLVSAALADEKKPSAPASTEAARKAEPADQAKKPESKPAAGDKITLTVVTTTGKVNKFAKAGGKSRFYVLINGDSQHKIRLDNPKKDDFKLGATDRFEKLPVNVPLDEIKSIRVLAEGDDMWKCETISFQFFQKDLRSHEYKFSPSRYLSGAKEHKNFNVTNHLDFKLQSIPTLAPPESTPDDKPGDKSKTGGEKAKPAGEKSKAAGEKSKAR